jgi:hypothetical protein
MLSRSSIRSNGLGIDFNDGDGFRPAAQVIQTSDVGSRPSLCVPISIENTLLG